MILPMVDLPEPMGGLPVAGDALPEPALDPTGLPEPIGGPGAITEDPADEYVEIEEVADCAAVLADWVSALDVD